MRPGPELVLAVIGLSLWSLVVGAMLAVCLAVWF
jgi:hypothetical protein